MKDMAGEAPTTRITFSIDDEWQSITQFLRAARPVLEAPAQRGGCIDLRECRYFGPYALAVIGSKLLACHTAARRLEVRVPSGPQPLVNYCEYSGLNLWRGAGRRPDRTHPDNETIPLSTIKASMWGMATSLVHLISGHIEIDPDSEDALHLCFSEVGQNIFDHSLSPIGGVYAARYLANRREVRVAIVDHGLGVPRTLGRKHIFDDDQGALRAVLTGGYSAQTYSRNRGHGINHLKESCARLGGEVILASGRCVAFVEGREDVVVTNLGYEFKGTAVFFRLPV